MAQRVNNDLSIGCFVEYKIRIRRRRNAPNGGIVGHGARERIPQKQIGDRANSAVDTFGSLQGSISDVVQNRREIGERRKRVA